MSSVTAITKLKFNHLREPGRAAGRNPLIIKHLRKPLFKKRANIGQNQKKCLKKIFH
jgi:hypothetical protein